jgi:hypothetical protein
MEFASYITGFTDGEGSFSISFSRRSKLRSGIEVRPSFSVSQHKRNLDILQELKKYFGVGAIRFSKSDQNYKYEVRSINDLVKKIIPHFVAYPLKTSKARDFEIFSEICFMISSNKHRSVQYLAGIIERAYLMNESGKRKYTKQVLLKFLTR